MFKNLVLGWLSNESQMTDQTVVETPPSANHNQSSNHNTAFTAGTAATKASTAPQRIELQPGYEIQEYRIDKVLGVGGFGITYKAHDMQLDEPVALKEYMPMGLASRLDGITVAVKNEASSSSFQFAMDSFFEEAKTLAKIRNYNVVRVRRLFKANNTAYMVMDFEEGQELKELLCKNLSPLDENELKGVVIPLLDGLEAIHQKNILHRDIKPSNIFIRNDGSPLLIDFGAAHSIDDDCNNIPTFVTFGYSPVEQYRGEGQGAWTDIYALGATLYHVITGKKPIPATEREQHIAEFGTDPLPPPGELTQGSYSKQFLDFIQMALLVDPQHRPQSLPAWRDIWLGHNHSTSKLYDGQKKSCNQVDANLQLIKVGLGWDCEEGVSLDLDASAVLLGKNGSVRTDSDFIFYNNLTSSCGAVRHLGDSTDGLAEGDDEIILVDLSKVPQDIYMIQFAVTINDPNDVGLTFGKVKNAYIHLLNGETDDELFFYNLNKRYSNETAITIGEIYRHGNLWIFGADSQGFAGGLGELVTNFGLDIDES